MMIGCNCVLRVKLFILVLVKIVDSIELIVGIEMLKFFVFCWLMLMCSVVLFLELLFLMFCMCVLLLVVSLSWLVVLVSVCMLFVDWFMIYMVKLELLFSCGIVGGCMKKICFVWWFEKCLLVCCVIVCVDNLVLLCWLKLCSFIKICVWFCVVLL